MNTSTPFSTMYRIIITLTSVGFLFTFPTLAQEATFHGLGDLEGGSFQSEALRTSADGSVVVGTSLSDGGPEAFRWENGEMEGLGDLPESPPGILSRGYDVSADGSVVVGHGFVTATPEAFRWKDGIMTGLGDQLPGGTFYSYAFGVSDNGSFIVGSGVNDQGGLEATRWEVDGDSTHLLRLGNLPGGEPFSNAYDVSSDGTVVVGVATSTDGFAAFRWENGTMTGLGDLPGGDIRSYAIGVSGDGSVVIGYSSSINDSEGFRWTSSNGMEGLGMIEGCDDINSIVCNAIATGVSADGTVIVGYSTAIDSTTGSADFEAFIWTEGAGNRNLKEVIEEDYGLDLTGWTLEFANGISDDGSTIVGSGISPDGNTEAWRAFLGKPIANEATPETLADVLSAPSPNPVSGTSTFTIAVERGQDVAVEVFDVMGRHVQTVYEGTLPDGMGETLTLDASALPAGVYVVRATGEDFTRTRRVTVVR